MPPEDDDVLIERAVRGDEQALERLFRRYYATINKFAQKICRDPTDAEDITQEAFVNLMGSIDSFDRRSAFSTWLYRVVLNKAIDLRRKDARRGRLAERLRQLTPSSYEAPQDATVAARQVVEFLLDFPERERDAALLVHGEGLTHRQAAEIIGCPVGTIGWLLSRAGKRLEEILEAKNDDRENAESRFRQAGAFATVAACAPATKPKERLHLSVKRDHAAAFLWTGRRFARRHSAWVLDPSIANEIPRSRRGIDTKRAAADWAQARASSIAADAAMRAHKRAHEHIAGAVRGDHLYRLGRVVSDLPRRSRWTSPSRPKVTTISPSKPSPARWTGRSRPTTSSSRPRAWRCPSPSSRPSTGRRSAPG